MTNNTVPFDISNSQKVLFSQSAIRTVAFERTNYRKLVADCEIIANSLTQPASWEIRQIEAACLSLIVKLDAALKFREHWGAIPNIELSSKNRTHLGSDADTTKFIRELRNGLAHPIDGYGIPQNNTRISGKDCSLFHVVQGQEIGLKYPKSLNAHQIVNDLLFGCGHLRISLHAQIFPLIHELRELPQEVANKPDIKETREIGIRVTGL